MTDPLVNEWVSLAIDLPSRDRPIDAVDRHAAKRCLGDTCMPGLTISIPVKKAPWVHWVDHVSIWGLSDGVLIKH